MAKETIVDTNILVGLLISKDQHHEDARRIYESLPKPVLVHVLTVAEVAHFLEARIGPEAELRFLEQIRDGHEIVVCYDSEDWEHTYDLAATYLKNALGTIDAAVMIAAERYGGRVASLDNLLRTVVTPRTPWFEVVP